VVPSIEVSQPEAPPIPVINVPDIKEPTISEMSEPTQPKNKPSKPAAAHNRQVPPRKQAQDSQDRWYSSYSRSGVPTARCESCSHGISGKIVTAGGCRFHPECFICFHCQTPLECVAFYEEPEASRNERLADAPSDEDRVPRFYCHLDFHELFSPRCKSCKTPIEGEVVVACGAEWHVGHFFCAECGDVRMSPPLSWNHLTDSLLYYSPSTRRLPSSRKMVLLGVCSATHAVLHLDVLAASSLFWMTSLSPPSEANGTIAASYVTSAAMDLVPRAVSSFARVSRSAQRRVASSEGLFNLPSVKDVKGSASRRMGCVDISAHLTQDCMLFNDVTV
jgi:LIM domain